MHEQQSSGMTGLGSVVTIANGAFAAVMITAMVRNEYSAIAAIIAGGIYYGLTTVAALLVLSGSLTTMVTHRMDQITVRQTQAWRVEAHNPAALTMPVADLLPVRTDPADPLPLGPGNYVPAGDLTVQRDAALWAVQLYDSDGQPDPAKVNMKGDREKPGRLKIAAPAAPQREWLLAKRVLEKIDHGYRLNLPRYPDAAALRDILQV